MIPQQIIDALKKVFAFVDDKLKVSDAQLDVALSTRASETTLAGVKSQIDKLSFADDKLKVTNPDLALSDNGNLKVVSIPEKSEEAVFSNKSISANSSEDFVVSDEYSAVVVTVKASYDASATAGVRVRWLYSPDGSNFDSVQDAEDAGNYEDLTFSAGATRQRTVLIPLLQKYTKVQIVNLDSAVSVTVDVWKTLLR